MSIHLYFDFDSIKSLDEIEEVLSWLSELVNTFGEFTFGGYTNNQEVADSYGFRLYPEGEHYLSMHVIFPDTRISTKDQSLIMKHDRKKGFLTQGFHRLCDPNVYKLVSKNEKSTVRQLFRHVLSDKIFSIGNDDNKENHGVSIDDESPSRHVVQVRGDEPIVMRDEWGKHFVVPQNESSTNSFAEQSPRNGSTTGAMDIDMMYP